METLSFEILGIPMSKQSARFRIIKGKGGKDFISSYQKKSVVDRETSIGWEVTELPQGFVPFDCPLFMEVEYVFPIPMSATKKFKQRIIDGEIVYKDTKPDLHDNLSKLVVDSLEGVVFINDSRISKMTAVKYYGTTPKTIIKFTAL